MKAKVWSRQTLRRCMYGGTALLLVGVAALMALARPTEAAQISARSIKISSSAAGATGTTYEVNFTSGSSYTVKAIIVDFCDNTPIIGDSTCTPSTGFDVGGATPSVTTSGALGSSGWTATGSNVFNTTEYRTLTITNSTGAALTGGSSVITFDLTTATNPSTANHSFYARILTYTTDTPTYAPGAEGSYSDYGGAALSTAAVVNVTARVMETLSFCVYNTTCGDSPALTIGHGANNILDGTAVDIASDKFDISTNAAAGAVVRLKGTTLTSGSNTIPAVNAGSATPTTISAGTAAFGLDIPVPGSMTVNATYVGTGTTTSNYGLDTTTANSITGQYGGAIASTTGPINSSTSTMTFAATASNTTPAGIYSASEQLIATGTF